MDNPIENNKKKQTCFSIEFEYLQKKHPLLFSFNKLELVAMSLKKIDQWFNDINHFIIKNEIDRTKNISPFHLKLSNIGITRFPDKTINEKELEHYWHHLISLDCSHNQLAYLPNNISKFQNLTKLNYSNNRLIFLNKDIGELKKITELDCSYNQLATLPSEIGKLTNLVGLYCNNNEITALPPEIGNLQDLIGLFCHDNKLGWLPERIGMLLKLEGLFCENNYLYFIPESIRQLSNLTTLHCQNNRLSHLPKKLGKLEKLDSLYCNTNPLQTLPKSLTHKGYVLEQAPTPFLSAYNHERMQIENEPTNTRRIYARTKKISDVD